MSAPRYAVGIDLGTTHCAMARAALDDVSSKSEVLAVAQLVARAEVAARPLLPSFVYLPPAAEGRQPLPWDPEREIAVGAYARDRGAEVPERVVSSAKSWLCHTGIDRRAGLLPLGAPEDVERISPVEASWRLLEHLVEAYDARRGRRDRSLAELPAVLTVPASFDASARELTVEAAMAAGLDELTLLEEPQAALYAWLQERGEGWRKVLVPGDVVLVVDVGGGTTDLSAIEVRDDGGRLSLRRVAVGNHILLGGDNLDLALAHVVAQQLGEQATELSAVQLSGLCHAVRRAKERLLSDARCERAPVVWANRGAKLVGGSRRVELAGERVRELVLEGFFPAVPLDAVPAASRRAGLRRLGLPYATDPAVTKHLASFLRRQAAAIEGSGAMLRPTRVLFNGGVMKSALLRERLLDVLNHWLGEDGAPPATLLEGGDVELAVARGAACYGRIRSGHGVRILGGAARAYYIGIEGVAPAIPGVEPPTSLMCVAEMGMEPGARLKLPRHQLAVVVGQAVRFELFGSSVRRRDRAGEVFDRYPAGEIEALAPVEITLDADGREPGEVVPVQLSAELTEVGTLLIEAVPLGAGRPDDRWKVELSVRGGPEGER